MSAHHICWHAPMVLLSGLLVVGTVDAVIDFFGTTVKVAMTAVTDIDENLVIGQDALVHANVLIDPATPALVPKARVNFSHCTH